MSHWNDVPEIEPLSETSWRRIERDVFAELDRNPKIETAAPETPHWLQRWRRPFVGLGLGLGLAAAAALLIGLRGSPDTRMSQPSRIDTDEAPAALTVGRAAIRVAPASIVWVQSSPDHEVMVMLEEGRVDCRVAHDEHQPPLVVQAGDVRVEVVGTSFAVMRQGSSTRVEVNEGVVKIFHDGRRVLVGAGQRWSTGPDAPRDNAGNASAPVADDRPGAASAAAADDTAAPAGSEAAAPAGPGPGSEPGAPLAGSGAGDGDGAPQPSPATRPGSADPGTASRAADPKDRYEKAARLEATDPAAAIAIYRELARGKSPWAANALFAQARLELDRGHRREAARLLRAYLQRHPGGNNAADARALLDVAE